jgi:hypothetical protein
VLNCANEQWARDLNTLIGHLTGHRSAQYLFYWMMNVVIAGATLWPQAFTLNT